jgi:outer membrane autotransporter protein
VGNGTASNFSGSGANYSATITPTNPGQVTIDVPAGIAQAVSSLTNLAAPQITVEFDPDAPSLAINGVPGLTNAAFTASFDFNEDVTGFDISDITLTNAVASSFASSSASSYTALITPQSDGDVLIDVAAAVAQDLGGNDNIAAPQAIAVFDSISPDVVISGVPATGNSPFTATFTFSENVTGFTVGDISLSNATASNFNGSGASYTALITPNGDGDITIDVAAAVAQDLASNDNTAAEQAVSEFDDAPPTVSINGVPELTNSAFTVTFEFSEAVTDFTLDDITVSNGSASNLEAAPDGPEGNSIFTATITPEDDGELVLAVDPDRFEDMAGNRNVEGVSMTLLIDLSPPTVIIGGVGESVNGPFQATFTFNEDVFNFEIGDITLSNATASEFSATSSSVYTATITPQTPGQVTIDVFADVANDLAGNGNLEAEQVTTEFTDNNLVRDRTLRIINNFIARRADQLTLDSPDLSRRILNIDAYGQLSGNAVIDNVQLAFQGAASGQDFNLDRLIGEDKASKLNLWTQISISAVNAETAEDDLIFVYLGADYRVSDNTILGAIAQYDYANEEDEIENFDISGHGWLFGPYIVSRLHENLVFDGRVSWGQSYNKISPFNSYEDNFKTDRWLLKGQFTGDFRLDGWRINPDFEMIYFEEKQKAYTDSLGNFIPSQIINLGRATFGPRVSKTYVVDNRYILSPSLNFEGIWDFDQAHIVSLETGLANTTDALRARLESGLALGFKNGSSLNLEGFYDGIGVSRYEAHGLRINFSLPF